MPPAIVSFHRRLLLVLGLATVNGLLYLASNAWSLRTPVPLPRTIVDAALGWHAWTVWPYLALLLAGPALALGIRERVLLHGTLRAYAIAIGLNLSIWLALPTRIARPGIPADVPAATHAAWNLLLALDGPNNCFPSGHVTIPLVIATGFCAQHPGARCWVWPLVVLLLPTVLTTGQHYAWDIAGGAATAALGLCLAGAPLVRRGAGTSGQY